MTFTYLCAYSSYSLFMFPALQTEKDTTIQRRAVDVLYAVCDKRNVTEIVGELLKFLERADYTIREELVLKVSQRSF